MNKISPPDRGKRMEDKCEKTTKKNLRKKQGFKLDWFFIYEYNVFVP